MKFPEIPVITIQKKWVYWTTAVAVVGMIVAITLVNLELMRPLMDYLFPIRKKYTFLRDVIPYDDKLWHFGSSGGFAVLFTFVLKNRQVSLFGKPIYWGAILAFTLIALEEFSQIFIKSRGFDLIDLTCDLAGIYVIGILAYPWILTKVRFTEDTKKNPEKQD